MRIVSLFKATGAVLLALTASLALFLAIFGWNWLRGPIERLTLERTGRELVIAGDLTLHYRWPLPSIHAQSVSFANPPWATEKQMVAAQAVEVTLDVTQLLRRKLAFSEVRLQRPVIFLEQGSGGRKNWLLDLQQQDEEAQILIGRITLDHAVLGYDDALGKTRIRAGISTHDGPATGTAGAGLSFRAGGSYKGLALAAQGEGDPVLALRDENKPYALTLDATLGRTAVQAQGTVTNLSTLSALVLQVKLRGDSLEQLFPLLGIALPATPAYQMQGLLQHSGKSWRYEKFSGSIGQTDIAGDLQVVLGGKRPVLSGTLASRRLDLADLGPVVGRAGPAQARSRAAQPERVLPDLPFDSSRWSSVDADVQWRAASVDTGNSPALQDLLIRLRLVDSMLTLDPLQVKLAGGQLNAVISLDGRSPVIAARASVQARKLMIEKLVKSAAQGKTSLGRLDANLDLAGQGKSVATMLGAADGKVQMVLLGGEVSRLTMERAGLHLWEMLQLKLAGDRQIKVRCALADFSVSKGTMLAKTLIFDTEVTTLVGSGTIDLRQERLDLRFNQKTKNTSPLALRSPIFVRGSFAKAEAGVDAGRVAVRALGAIALGLMNPLLALIPLIDAGPGNDSECAALPGLAMKK